MRQDLMKWLNWLVELTALKIQLQEHQISEKIYKTKHQSLSTSLWNHENFMQPINFGITTLLWTPPRTRAQRKKNYNWLLNDAFRSMYQSFTSTGDKKLLLKFQRELSKFFSFHPFLSGTVHGKDKKLFTGVPPTIIEMGFMFTHQKPHVTDVKHGPCTVDVSSIIYIYYLQIFHDVSCNSIFIYHVYYIFHLVFPFFITAI